MSTWVVIFGVFGALAGLGAGAFAVRYNRPNHRHVIAGGFATFLMGLLVIVTAVARPHPLTWIMQVLLFAGAMGFFVLDIRLWRRDRA